MSRKNCCSVHHVFGYPEANIMDEGWRERLNVRSVKPLSSLNIMPLTRSQQPQKRKKFENHLHHQRRSKRVGIFSAMFGKTQCLLKANE